ncbi:hypothetical protein E2C01_067718 [Portunus trituberculatus]|uniref:Uncharacterized protein n=1 Tax=Portunus trituberculatus TaxID=210409 RepID=A0A5B7HKJ8_PORTR|nr:hypothetical protein [Portunus trituberculatus]
MHRDTISFPASLSAAPRPTRLAVPRLVWSFSRGQKAPKIFIQRRTSDGELYTHRRAASASNYSLNLERHGTVHETRRHDAITLPSKAGSFRRLTSSEKDDRPVVSLEDLHKTAMEQMKESHDSNAERSASLNRKNIPIYVEGILKEGSLDLMDPSGKFDDTSDEDLDKTPTDGTPICSSASDLTPTGSVEDVRLKMYMKKKFSKRWWKDKYRRRSIVEGESVLKLKHFLPLHTIVPCAAPFTTSIAYYGKPLHRESSSLQIMTVCYIELSLKGERIYLSDPRRNSFSLLTLSQHGSGNFAI